MKILLISEGRCGSYSLLEWLSTNFNLKIFAELEDIDITDDYVVKRGLDSIDMVNEYEYVIRLYREDVIGATESNLWAIRNNTWHFDYTISREFLITNHEEIVTMMNTFNTENEILKNIDKGLLISYEEIFLDGTGQDKLETYFNFKSEEKLVNKLNKIRTQSHISDFNITRNLIIDEQNTNILKKDVDLHLLLKENTELKDMISSLQDEIKILKTKRVI